MRGHVLEEKYVRLWLMDLVVLPPQTLDDVALVLIVTHGGTRRAGLPE